jgi:hypothetical protein
MRIAKDSTFRKLWAKAKGARNLSTLSVNATCHFPLESFAGERWAVLVRPGGLGGRNAFLAYLNFVIAIICWMGATMFALVDCNVGDHARKPSSPMTEGLFS